MMATDAVGGSQIDVQSLVSQLVTAERARPEALLASEAGRVTTQISGLGQLMGALTTFRSALSSLNTLEVFSTRSAVSSQDSLLGASASGKAVPGTYDIEILQLAQAQQISSGVFAEGAAGLVGTGTLTLSLGERSFEVEITAAGSSLGDIRDAINSAAGNVGVRATLVQGGDGSRLVLSSAATGAANTITVTQSGGDGGLAPLEYSDSSPGGYALVKAAQDAIVNIANAQTTSADNTIANAIDGVTLTLKQPTSEEGGPVTLTIDYDQTAVTARIKSFVNAYNALVSQVTTLRSYDTATATAGPMLGDSLLNSIEAELRRSLSAVVPGQAPEFATLAAVGITTQANGTLGVDEAKLQKALSGNFEAVGKLFGSQDGIGARLFAQVDTRLKSDGALETRGKNLVDQQRAITRRKEDLDARMLVIQQAYLRQFTRLDILLSQLQVTSSYLSQQIESLGNLNKASS
ncbi:flagellar hook-associated protein 2 FliD [Steroidobacter denitrificans]|uniref:Flagellar hook-associated protein 2 n=1 Tax=Steroidobacter denitrificans TaxID=465721 RepID=A0A127FAF7_STEDE|nr:flagellar filament capping protein FliD [Steroidobacter denitrificans]AMN46588.1 flagellar hook-associated protein 2 FliD [Steroidobacter denitrificans]